MSGSEKEIDNLEDEIGNLEDEKEIDNSKVDEIDNLEDEKENNNSKVDEKEIDNSKVDEKENNNSKVDEKENNNSKVDEKENNNSKLEKKIYKLIYEDKDIQITPVVKMIEVYNETDIEEKKEKNWKLITFFIEFYYELLNNYKKFGSAITECEKDKFQDLLIFII